MDENAQQIQSKLRNDSELSEPIEPTEPSQPYLRSESTQSESNSTKIDLLLRAAGDAPIIKKKKWSVDQNRSVGWITEFIRRFLKLESHESLFIYVNQTFSPSPDQCVKNLYDCFGSDGKLILYYAKSQAWG